MGVIEAAGLTKAYPHVRALDDLTVTIGEGAVGLLGPNGAGKSTLIKILLGFLKPTSGSVRVLGLDPSRAPVEIRRRIGFMPELESFIPGMSAVDSVYLAARLSGLPHPDAMQRTHMVLNYLGVGEERYRNVETFSTGMKQKVKLAQAIVHHPSLLLLDEPTAGLDPRAREEMLELIRDVARGHGINVILSTHILHDIEAVCDRVAILHRGRLVAYDEIGKLMSTSTEAYDVEIQGDRPEFLLRLRAEKLECAELEEGVIRVIHPGGTEPILRAAVGARVQLRHLARSQSRMEDMFMKLLGD